MPEYPRTANHIANLIDCHPDTVTKRFRKSNFIFFGIKLKVIRDSKKSPYRISEESYQRLANRMKSL